VGRAITRHWKYIYRGGDGITGSKNGDHFQRRVTPLKMHFWGRHESYGNPLLLQKQGTFWATPRKRGRSYSFL
jgi:hypothetical protein